MKKFLGVSLIAALVALFGVAGSTVNAEEAKNSAPYIGISPYRQTFEIEPGHSYTGKFRVSNVGEGEFEYKVSVSPYQVSDERYSIDMLTMNDYTRIVDWITFSEEGRTGKLQPHSASDYITFTINVPEDVPTGSQFAIIRATAINDSSDKEGFTIQNETSAGMIIYTKVNGVETRTDAEIIENKFPTFLTSGPLEATTLVANKGNIYATAKYSLRVTSIFNDQDVVYSNEDEDEELTTSLLLPETKRLRIQRWENTPVIGIFKVKQTVKIFDEESSIERIVIICPFWFIILIIVAIVAIILWLRSRFKARKAII